MNSHEPLFLTPVFHERLWGGDSLARQFQYTLPSDKTGEAWVISAHPNGPSTIQNGPLAGTTLDEAWNRHGHLFNRRPDQTDYPLLVKLLDAADELSVQVHPDDTYAQQVEKVPFGKTECWYILSAEEGASIVFGHHAKDADQLRQSMHQGKWDTLLRRIPVRKGDFIYVPSGTLHAIGKGITLIEIQQNSDTTYRVYDYNRTDPNGQKRQLHLPQSLAVTTVPHQDPKLSPVITQLPNLTETHLITEPNFTVKHWNLTGSATIPGPETFYQLNVINGSATITTHQTAHTIQKGTNLIVPHGTKTLHLTGEAEIILSHP